MASPSSQSLVKRTSDTELMPPPPPPKRIKRPPKVLDEDDYTDALSHIVARDFFPGLLETQTQQEYLDALESKDRVWINSAGRRLTEVMTPGSSHGGRTTRGRRGVSMTPRMGTPRAEVGGVGAATPRDWAGDTPMSVAASSAASSGGSTPGGSTLSSSTGPRSKGAVPEVEDMSLGAFQAKYTSEDNESFNKVLDKQNAKRRDKYAWMWDGNKIPTARQIAYRKREAKRLESQRQTSTADSGNNGNDVNEDGDKQLVVAGGKAGDERPAKPDAWKAKPENPLMFMPSSVEDSHETVQQKAEAASRAGPKHVMYQNTRVQPLQTGDGNDDNNDSSSVPPSSSASVSAVRDAIAGRPRPTDSESGFTGGETPRVNGYSFVDEEEPVPNSGDGDDDDDERAFHLRLLSSQTSNSDASNPFQLQETRKREALHHRMVERVARDKRTEKVAQEIKTPVPRFGSSPMITRGRTPGSGSTPKGGSRPTLTPAAQRLWANVGTPRRPSGEGSNKGTETGLKNMWTSTPKKTK